ncbi:GDSL-type esterase/lipase family protein [Pectobacterium sp. 21LCBS03]|uniref:GDSL-type esterase/lipase family protein n=1 Tax=Pectobacterium sp. 21LCBS03 TaxID=2935858 RepID=UPI0020105B6A|nr:GDSL-type esterase/lipase family protein [Pectobacterium sp. 21LCBS03]UPY96275.1 GDSL-type esterase/lipase family protein [Pectobacterium sp. 21LCBS03]
MTVSTEISREEYTGNGVTTTFPYRFRITNSSFMLVKTADLDGNEATLVLNTDYTLTGVKAYSGGNVILTNALPSGWRILLERDMPLLQGTDLRNQGTFLPEVHEDAFDYMTMLIQKVFSRFNLALRRPSWISNHYDAQGYQISNVGSPISGQDATNKNYVDSVASGIDNRALRVLDGPITPLPNAAERANKVPAFDSSGNPLVMIPASGSAADVLIQLSQYDGFKNVGGSHVFRMTLAQAKSFPAYAVNQRVFITDLGYLFKFNADRNIIPGQPASAIATDDELHKLVASGGMLEFDDYDKLSSIESQNYAKYLSRLRTNKSIGMVAYGDSITWGQRPDGGQYPLNYPVQIAQTMSSRTQCAWSAQNMASPGDRALTNYVRNINDGTAGHISTIMLGVNDIKAATDNGNNPDDIEGDTLYGVKSYAVVMRKFIARELLRGRCVVILGTTQWVSGANSSPMSNMTECYLSQTYDSAANAVASEFGCMFVDTMRDVIQQFGISESCHDGIHLREDFLPIIGKRFACVFMQQDYKKPRKVSSGDVFIPGFFQNPISSNRTINHSSFTNGSSPPLGGGTDNPESIGVMLPNDDIGGSVTFAIYIDKDNVVAFPSINSNGTLFFIDVIGDDGATQPDYPSDVEIIPVLRDRQYIVSGRSISGSAPKNRATEKYTVQRVNGCYMHFTTRGWHMLTFAVGQNAGVAAVEGVVFDSWSNVKNNDVYGGVSGTLFRRGVASTMTGFVNACTSEATGVFDVAISNLVPENYRVEVEYTEDAALIHHRVIFKAESSFRIQFYNAAGALINPTSFRATVLGGR